MMQELKKERTQKMEMNHDVKLLDNSLNINEMNPVTPLRI
jgi:hypothetical protein